MLTSSTKSDFPDVTILRVSPAVGPLDPTEQRGYAVEYSLYGLSPLLLVVPSFDHDYLIAHTQIGQELIVLNCLMAHPDVQISNVSNPVLPQYGNPLHTFNVEFFYKHHGPFSVWEPVATFVGDSMCRRAQHIIDTIDKIVEYRV